MKLLIRPLQQYCEMFIHPYMYTIYRICKSFTGFISLFPEVVFKLQ